MVDANQSLGFAIDIAKGIDFLLNLEGGMPNVTLNSKHIMVSTYANLHLQQLTHLCS